MSEFTPGKSQVLNAMAIILVILESWFQFFSWFGVLLVVLVVHCARRTAASADGTQAVWHTAFKISWG